MSIRVAFAGDRQIAVNALKFILKQGVKPLALLVPDGKIATHGDELIRLCSHLGRNKILSGHAFRTEAGVRLLKKLKLDYIISVHFPYIYPGKVLRISGHGALNLHPAYLPYNRGWHTPTWAIVDQTPFGATLHFMAEAVDVGDIVHQRKIRIRPVDTADSLYRRVLELELRVLKEAWPQLETFTYRRRPQSGKGTSHRKKDLQVIQLIELDRKVRAGDLIRRLRALTTDKEEEAAYFVAGGKKYRVRIDL